MGRLSPEEYFTKINENKDNMSVRRESFRKNDKNKDANKDEQTEQYFIFNEKIIEKKYEHLYNITNTFSNFYIDIKKSE